MALVHKLGWDPHFVRRSPWFWPIAQAAQRFELLDDWPKLADFDALYAESAARSLAPALRFANNVRKQDKRVDGRVVVEALYDGRIAVRAEVPTRERDWHDLFNMLCFASFPLAKNALHHRQYAALRARVTADMPRLPNARTPEQDALTLFDEGGAVVLATAAAAEQLAENACGQETVERLQQQGVARVVPFGHALFEHLVEDLRCPGGCTHVAVVAELPHSDSEATALTDRALAQALGDARVFSSPRACAHLRLDTLGILPSAGARAAAGRDRR